jgi:thymidylate kinase
MSKKTEAILQNQLDVLVSFLVQEGVTFALLGDPTGKKILASDLDLCTENIEMFDDALRKFCSNDGRLLLTKRFHATGIRYDFSFRHGSNTFIFPGPDVLIFPTWHIKGNIGLSYATLLNNCNDAGEACYQPSVSDAFLFYLIKRIDKGEIGEEQGAYLTQLWKQNPLGIQDKLNDFFSVENVNLISNAGASGRWDAVSVQLLQLTTELTAREKISYSRWIWFLKRSFYRLFAPTGLFVVFLGSDGSGKSSVIAKVFSELVPPFSNSSYTHLRPGLGLKKGQGAVVTDPHSKAPRGVVGSIVKLIYFLCDYGVGYFLKIRPLLVKSTLVVFDRYYYDLLIDPKRYRYGGPMWFARLIDKLIPKPDIVILLDAPPEVLQARKQEVPFEETARQREAYLQYVKKHKNGVVIDASKPLKHVVCSTNMAIIKLMSRRVGSS